jgi:hypothetical protein
MDVTTVATTRGQQDERAIAQTLNYLAPDFPNRGHTVRGILIMLIDLFQKDLRHSGKGMGKGPRKPSTVFKSKDLFQSPQHQLRDEGRFQALITRE